MRHDRFHGRFESKGRGCDAPGCDESGEFRAPGARGPSFDGPGEWRWFCLDHVRAFNAGYDFFEGMSAEEILDAQSPVFGWRNQARVYSGMGGDGPRWADFEDPLEAISARARGIRGERERQWRQDAEARQRGLDGQDRRALDELGLGYDADRRALRKRYSELVRRFHPDRNGGDRGHEAQLQRVVSAYQHLRKLKRFTG